MHSEKIAKGATYLTIQSVTMYLFSFLFYIIVSRALDATDIGKLSLLMMIGSVFSLTNPSLHYALQKFIPKFVEEGRRDVSDSIIRTGLVVLVAISGTALIILLIMNTQVSTLLFGSTLERWPLIIILLATFILNFTIFFGGQMLGLGMFKETAIQNILNTGISRPVAIVLALSGLGLLGITLGWLIGAVVALVFSIYALRRNLNLKRGFSVKRILEFSIPVHLLAIIMFIQGWADIAILYALGRDLSQIGVYYLVISGALILTIFYVPISMTILPALSARYTSDGIEGMSSLANTYIRIIFKILIPVGISFAVISSTAIELIYGLQYVSGAIPFGMIAATSVLPAFSLLIVAIIQATGNTRPLITMGLASSLADVVLVATLASSLGGIAGAAGRIAFSAVGAILGYYLVRDKIKLNILSELKQPLIAAATVATPLFVIDQFMSITLNLPLIMRVSIDVLAFTTMATIFIYISQYFTAGDFDLLRQAMPKRLGTIITKIERILNRQKSSTLDRQTSISRQND